MPKKISSVTIIYCCQCHHKNCRQYHTISRDKKQKDSHSYHFLFGIKRDLNDCCSFNVALDTSSGVFVRYLARLVEAVRLHSAHVRPNKHLKSHRLIIATQLKHTTAVKHSELIKRTNLP